MAAGLLELQKMVEDLDLGPREEKARAGEGEDGGLAFGFGLPKMG